MAGGAVPVEMRVAYPPKPTDNDMPGLFALVALLVGMNFRFGVGGTPLRHSIPNISELGTPEKLNYMD
jgi:hypothetical protein